MNAIERWDHMVRVEHEQSDRMRGRTPPPADHWTPYAREFKADPRRSGNALLDHLRSRVDPGQTVIDIGAGGGSLALPLALHCQRVVAVEPSPSMCLVLRETASEFNVPNVDVVESDWMNAVVDRAGVTLCSHVVYVIREIGAFVRKLEDRAANLVLVVLHQASPQSQLYPLWETVHREPRLPLPSLPEFREVLGELGVQADETAMPSQPTRGFDSTEDAREQLVRRLYVSPGTPQMERLEGALPQVLEEHDGGYRIKGAEALTPHVVSWRPRLSPDG